MSSLISNTFFSLDFSKFKEDIWSISTCRWRAEYSEQPEIPRKRHVSSLINQHFGKRLNGEMQLGFSDSTPKGGIDRIKNWKKVR